MRGNSSLSLNLARANSLKRVLTVLLNFFNKFKFYANLGEQKQQNIHKLANNNLTM